MASRFYFAGELQVGEVQLSGAEAHHVNSVRRFCAGDRITMFNGDGNEYPAEIIEVGKNRVSVRILGVESPQRELGFRLHIASALPKADRTDFLIEKLTELGVTDFTPLNTSRSIVKADPAKTAKLQRAVIEASKQCGRNTLMAIHAPAHWQEWCPKQVGSRFIADPLSQSAIVRTDQSDIMFACGPEGGFTPEEIALATNADWKSVSLGPRVLRVETACVAIAAILGSSPR